MHPEIIYSHLQEDLDHIARRYLKYYENNYEETADKIREALEDVLYEIQEEIYK